MWWGVVWCGVAYATEPWVEVREKLEESACTEVSVFRSPLPTDMLCMSTQHHGEMCVQCPLSLPTSSLDSEMEVLSCLLGWFTVVCI